MSYLFDASNHRMTGTFTSSYSDNGFTIGYFAKLTHPLAAQGVVFLGNNSASRADSIGGQISATANTYTASSYDSTPTINTAAVAQNIDGVWAGIVCKFGGTNLRDIYVQALANHGQDTGSRAVADVLKYILVGERLGGDLDFTSGLLAEVAMWNTSLADASITSYMGGLAASQIEASNLVGYWPLNYDNSTQTNEGVDAGGDLTVTTATYSSDHPTITTGSSKGRMLMLGVG